MKTTVTAHKRKTRKSGSVKVTAHERNITDRKVAGYEAPWFPWTEAGFTDEERDGCVKLFAANSDIAEEAEASNV